MQRARRPRMSAAEKAELWARWKRGESLSDIARALDRIPGAVFQVLATHGGVAPAPRRRSRLVLTVAEREDIFRAVVTGASFREISRELGRAPSTVSREVRRHGGRRHYRAAAADASAWRAARRPKRCWLARAPALRLVIAERLAADWSPQQIAGWLRLTYPDNPAMQVSKGTDLSTYSQPDLNVVAKRLNTRPRKTLGYETPADRLAKVVALTD